MASPGLLRSGASAVERTASFAVLMLMATASVLLARSVARIVQELLSARQSANAVLMRMDASLTELAARLSAIPTSSDQDARRSAIAGIRSAIAAEDWMLATRRLADLERESPESPDYVALADEIAKGRQGAADAIRAKLDAARAVNDSDGVLSAREGLATVLMPEALAELDRDLVRWLMGIIQKRMRGGQVSAEVALLAERVSDLFAATVEGASLRASLPILRRSSGLCPRCARPYIGIDEACPECLGPAAEPSAIPSLDELISRPADLNAYAEASGPDQGATPPKPDTAAPHSDLTQDS